MVDVIVTRRGLAKIAEASVENPLVLEYFAVGDGGGNEIIPNEDMTSLVNEKHRDYINSKYSSNNKIVVECILRANALIEEGFYLRELGIFDAEEELIVIVKLPESYRPALEDGQTGVENIFNVDLKIENTEAITIAINETVFASKDSLERLVTEVETIKNNNKKLIESLVGIEKWFNTDARYQDQDIVKIGIKTYALMDSTNILNIADYPILFTNLNAVDRGDGTFAVPSFHDGTIRHIAKGDTSRVLGDFQADALQNITGTLDAISSTVHRDMGGVGALSSRRNGGDHYSAGNFILRQFSASFDASGATDPEGNPVKTDDFETRMKNTAGQWYILAKIDF